MFTLNWLRVLLFAGALVALPFAASAQTSDDEEVDTLLAMALELHKAGDLFGAARYYEIALEMTPDRADIRSNLGAAYVGLGRFDSAIEEYRKALALRDEPSIRLNLALALYKAGRNDESIPELEQVVRADPGNLQAVLLLADTLLTAERYEEVITLLTPLDEAFEHNLAYAYLLGTALLRTDDTQQAQAYIDRIFKDGDTAEGRLLMGMALMSRQDHPAAVKELARAVEINPDLPTVQLTYGRALLATGDRESAWRAFRRAAEQAPDSFDANLALGNVLRLEQKYDEALVYLRRAQAIRPKDLGLRHALAASYLGAGNAEAALELLEPLVQEAPDFVDAHVLLGTTYYRLRRREDGDRQREIIDRLNAQRQAQQPGARAGEPASAQEQPSAPPQRN
jgi:tetratricopeptide (TPR) repeat protein